MNYPDLTLIDHLRESAKPIELFGRVRGEGTPPVVILHGVFGSGDNWGTFGRQLEDRHEVHLLDLRNHGASPHSDTFDYPSMAADVHAYLERHDLRDVVLIGHSLGGKVTMFTGWLFPQRISKLVVVDIAPRGYHARHHPQLDGLRALDPATLESRSQAVERLSAHIPQPDVVQFLLKSLARTAEGGFELKLNVEAIASMLEEGNPPLPKVARIALPTLFIGGGRSDYITPDDEGQIAGHFTRALVEYLPKAGHWVHVDAPDELLTLVEDFIEGAAPAA